MKTGGSTFGTPNALDAFCDLQIPSDAKKKHKFRVTSPGVLFMETASSPPEHEK
jgi:hypothetical protein